jgi:hypothetical protein
MLTSGCSKPARGSLIEHRCGYIPISSCTVRTFIKLDSGKAMTPHPLSQIRQPLFLASAETLELTWTWMDKTPRSGYP